MKRLFKEFLKTYKRVRKLNPAQVTILFNRWIGQAKTERGGIKVKRFQFNGHTKKHVIRKWLSDNQ